MKRAVIRYTFIILLLAGSALTADFSGTVHNRAGEPVAGVNIRTDLPGLSAVTDKDGHFTLTSSEELPSYLSFSHVSYQPHLIRVRADRDMSSLKVVIEPAVYPGQNIRVTAMRARAGLTPVTFTDFTEEHIRRDYTVSDFPILLETTPNLYAFSYTGGAVGATEYRIRGFDSKRIGVYINGIPLNDPEDHLTYFYDLPDFAAGVSDIQIQRGIGNSLYGDASFGGSINIASAGIVQARKVTLTSGYGRYYSGGDYVSEMRKQAVAFSSGLIDGRWSLTGRYSKLYSGGYRENAWYDGWSYFLSLSRLDENMTTTVNVYGGPMKAHLAFDGIDRETMKENRRTNWNWYENEIDDFNQPHYELHHTYQINERFSLKNTLYYIRGKGYYEGYKDGKGYFEYNIPLSAVIDNGIDEIDLVRQKWVTKNQYGWNPRLDWDHRKGSASFGASLYYFDSEHWGEIVWAENVTLDPRRRYYEYFGKKYSGSVYAVENYHVTDKLRFSGNLQLRYLKYNFDQPPMGVYEGYNFDLDWLFFSPHLGATYLVNSDVSVFFNSAVSSRESDDRLIFDADYPYAKPAIDDEGELLADAERVYNFELGGNWRGDRHQLGLSLYWMEFRNEIIQATGIDDDGRPLLTNADRSVHTGVELEASYHAHRNLMLGGNAAYNHNRLKDYVVENDTDWDGTIDETLNYSGNPIAGFPDFIGNLILDFKIDPVRLVCRLRAVGRQYIENGKNRELSIDPYMVSSLTASISLGSLSGAGRFTVAGVINNLFDKKYELAGAVWDGTGYYIPAAERNFFVQLVWELE
ncbi:MAG: TonB-dependent receptor [Candidatus Zixiibacteriota bacterium]|nr:MAG: TonB-dependent receptor [candidate division Zixibacteria bacterium]